MHAWLTPGGLRPQTPFGPSLVQHVRRLRYVFAFLSCRIGRGTCLPRRCRLQTLTAPVDTTAEVRRSICSKRSPKPAPALMTHLAASGRSVVLLDYGNGRRQVSTDIARRERQSVASLRR